MSASGLTTRELLSQRRKRDAAIKATAGKLGTTAANVRHQVSFALFFARLFATEEGARQWLVLGGNALLIRTGGGRFTTDIDLARADEWDSPEELQNSLEEALLAGDRPDGFEFRIVSCTQHAEPDLYGYGKATAKVQMKLYFADREFSTFSVDATVKRHIDTRVDIKLLTPILDNDPALRDIPGVPLVPIENHLADKICALYELHGAQKTEPSNRYRDLADIIRIVEYLDFNPDRLVDMLRHEQSRRKITLPQSMEVPGPDWPTEYPRAAGTYSGFPKKYHDLVAALQRAQLALGPLLERVAQENRDSS